MKLIYAKDPVWANRSNTLINLTVCFEEIKEELLFTADPNDSEAHGRDIYAQAVSGAFGDIGAFTAKVPPEVDVSNKVRAERDLRIAKTDWTQLPDAPQATKDLWEPYRQALRDFPQQEGFPWYALVVSESDFGFTVDATKAPFPNKPS